jgi:hypothetical protein
MMRGKTGCRILEAILFFMFSGLTFKASGSGQIFGRKVIVRTRVPSIT